MNLKFLENLTLIDTGRLRAPKTLNPDGVKLRIMANGDVYPSEGLVKKYNLEYKNRTEVSGSGIDVIDSKEWGVLADKPRMILFGFVGKDHPKIDLFAQCRYNDDNSPKSSVMSQGTSSTKLLELVKSMGYMTEDQKYCDLVIVEQYPIKMEDGIAHIPKVIERGELKGEKTYQRRENEVFYPVITVEEEEKMRQEESAQTVQAGEVVTTN